MVTFDLPWMSDSISIDDQYSMQVLVSLNIGFQYRYRNCLLILVSVKKYGIAHVWQVRRNQENIWYVFKANLICICIRQWWAILTILKELIPSTGIIVVSFPDHTSILARLINYMGVEGGFSFRAGKFLSRAVAKKFEAGKISWQHSVREI